MRRSIGVITAFSLVLLCASSYADLNEFAINVEFGRLTIDDDLVGKESASCGGLSAEIGIYGNWIIEFGGYGAGTFSASSTTKGKTYDSGLVVNGKRIVSTDRYEWQNDIDFTKYYVDLVRRIYFGDECPLSLNIAAGFVGGKKSIREYWSRRGHHKYTVYSNYYVPTYSEKTTEYDEKVSTAEARLGIDYKFNDVLNCFGEVKYTPNYFDDESVFSYSLGLCAKLRYAPRAYYSAHIRYFDDMDRARGIYFALSTGLVAK